MKKNQITFSDGCNYINELIREPFFIVKSKMNHVILQCKINNIEIIDDMVAEKYLKDGKDKINKNKEKSQETVKNYEQKA